MTPRAYGLLALLVTLLVAATCRGQDAPRKRPCTFAPLPDGRTLITCPRPVQGPGKGKPRP